MTSEKVKLISVDKDKFYILENLMRYYLHDLSAFTKELQIDEAGKFVYDGLEYYFSEEVLKPFFIYYNNELAGFVLLNSGRYVSIGVDYSIHEFFILKSYRKQGVGKIAAKLVFDRFKGRYKIAQLTDNKPAIAFWKAVYDEYGIKYNEMHEKSCGEECLIQIFSVGGEKA